MRLADSSEQSQILPKLNEPVRPTSYDFTVDGRLPRHQPSVCFSRLAEDLDLAKVLLCKNGKHSHHAEQGILAGNNCAIPELGLPQNHAKASPTD